MKQKPMDTRMLLVSVMNEEGSHADWLWQPMGEGVLAVAFYMHSPQHFDSILFCLLQSIHAMQASPMRLSAKRFAKLVEEAVPDGVDNDMVAVRAALLKDYKEWSERFWSSSEADDEPEYPF